MAKRNSHTLETLRNDLRLLGVKAGYDLIVHTSLRSLGEVIGGYRNFLEALLAVIGPESTIVVPAFYYGNIDPAGHSIPPPESELEEYRARCRPFSPMLTQSQEGSFGEMVRLDRRGFRSLHPIISFAAIGRRAKEYTVNHKPDDADGIDSPIGRIYQRAKGQILLVGVDHIKNTSLHLAESLAGCPHYQRANLRYKIDNNSWGELKGIGGCSGGFHKIRGLIDFQKYEISGRVGDARTILVEQKRFVDATRDALIETPWALLCENPHCRDCTIAREIYGLPTLLEREYHLRSPLPHPDLDD